MPIFTDLKREIIDDCKLSKLAYGLVWLNTDLKVASAGQWQIQILKAYFD